MTLSPELLAMIADVPAATDEEIEHIGWKMRNVYGVGRDKLYLIARIVAEQSAKEVRELFGPDACPQCYTTDKEMVSTCISDHCPNGEHKS